MRILIACVGNELFGDDGAGIYVYKKLSEERIDAEIYETSGIDIVEKSLGFDKVIVVDTVIGEGRINRLGLEHFKTRSFSAHSINIYNLFRFAEKYVKLPEIEVYAIGIREENTELGEGLSERTIKLCDEVVESIKEELLR